jgi:S-adenosylmethionine decarboxylase
MAVPYVIGALALTLTLGMAITVPHRRNLFSAIADWLRARVRKAVPIEETHLNRDWTVFTSDDDGNFKRWLDDDDFHNPHQPDALPSLGSHLLVELYGCDPKTLEQEGLVRTAMVEAARNSDASLVTDSFHEFKPFGVSGAVIIQESHFTIHTWPEHGYAAVDLFYCSNIAVDRAVETLQRFFKPKRTGYMVVRRGSEEEVERYAPRR